MCRAPPRSETPLRPDRARMTGLAGRRPHACLKIKPAHTLDLVVLAAEWGHGRRRGYLSNLHLGARDPRPRPLNPLAHARPGMARA